MHFFSGSKVWHPVITIKVIIKLEPVGKTQTHCIHSCLQESLAFLQEFPNQNEKLAERNRLHSYVLVCQFRTDGKFHFHLLNQSIIFVFECCILQWYYTTSQVYGLGSLMLPSLLNNVLSYPEPCQNSFPMSQ